jgi:hypothetical protein
MSSEPEAKREKASASASASIEDRQKICADIEAGLADVPTVEQLHQRFLEGMAGDDFEAYVNPPMTSIIDGFLYLGNQRNAGVIPPKESGRDQTREVALSVLEQSGVKCIITVSIEAVPEGDKFPGFEYFHFPIGDTPRNESFPKQFPHVVETINLVRTQNKGVLIHCNAGASRSASCVIGYLISLGLKFEDAFKYVKNKRLIVDIGHFDSLLKGDALYQSVQ